MQKSNKWDAQHVVSFSLYQVKEGEPQLLNGTNYDKKALLLAKSGPSPASLREITGHFDLPPGNYVIIPYTAEAGQEAEFLLRIYSETKLSSEELDVITTIGKTGAPAVDKVQQAFTRSTRGDEFMEALELTEALNQLISEDGSCDRFFTIDVSRSLVNIYGHLKNGLLNLEEFRVLIKDVFFWMEKFSSFDRDQSGSIDTYELSSVFSSVGFRLSRQVLESIVRRYGGKECRLSKHDFIHSCCKILGLHNYFVQAPRKDATDNLEFDVEKWLAATLFF